MMNKNEVRIGDKIWFQENWTGRITYGIVTEISDNDVRLDGVSRDDNSFIGSSGAIWGNMYKTKDDAVKGVREKDDRLVAKYKAMMPDIKGLVQFALDYNTCRCEEYTDECAIRAYTERAKELGVLD